MKETSERTPDRQRAEVPPPSRLVDPTKPGGWAPIPTRTVPSALHLEQVLNAMWAPDATSWISADGRRYVVPGRYGRDTLVHVTSNNPGDWVCNCQRRHEAESYGYAVLQVAGLRGTLLRRPRS